MIDNCSDEFEDSIKKKKKLQREITAPIKWHPFLKF